uniref:Uncharacterized protein n=1 Tax=Ciona savignyi TaxID=51511 RepID=H2YE42_CIOSA
MLTEFIENAEFFIQRAEQCEVTKKFPPSTSKWRSIHSQLHDMFVEEFDEEVEEEPVSKRTCLSSETLKTLCERDESLDCLIVNLFPPENGYSIMLRG